MQLIRRKLSALISAVWPRQPRRPTAPAGLTVDGWPQAIGVKGLLIGTLLMAANWAMAVPPVNDQCSGAEVIAGNGPFPHLTALINVSNATTSFDPPTPSCQAMISRSVWYRFTPTNSAPYTISTLPDDGTGTTVEDTIMAVYTSAGGCNGPFTEVTCADDLGDTVLLSAVTVPLFADTTYYIVVWLFGTDAPNAGHSLLQLAITSSMPPANDTCANPIQVPLGIPIHGTTVGAGNDYKIEDMSCFSGPTQHPTMAPGRDVVYKFTAPSEGAYSFKVHNYRSETGFDLVVYLSDTCPMGGVPYNTVNCLAGANRSPASSAEEIFGLPLTNHQQVFIFVDDALDSGVGSGFTLEVTRSVRESEPNNSTSTANGPIPCWCGVEGAITPAGEPDYFELGTFPQGWRVFAMVDGEAANVPDFELRITTADDTLEIDQDDNDALFGASSPNIAGTPLTAAKAFARVSYNGPFTAEPYRLYAVVQPPLSSATPESEPNGSVAQANSAANNYFRGTLSGASPSTDADFYLFGAETGDLIFVSLDGDPLRDNTPINARLELLDESGNILVAVDDGTFTSTTNVNQTSPGEALVYRTPVEGTFAVRVSIGRNSMGLPQSGPAGNGDYLLSITKNCVPGSLGTNSPPILTNIVVTPSINEGGMASLSGVITDLDVADSHRLIVDWGDGSAPLTNIVPVSVTTFDLGHLYLDDGPTGTPSDLKSISVSVSDYGGGAAVGAASLTILNSPPSITDISAMSPIPWDKPATITGAFADPGIEDTFQLTINWGDGSAAQVLDFPAGGSGSFNPSHLYLKSGTNFNVSLTLRDDDNGMAATNVVVVVGPAPGPPHFTAIARLANSHVLLSLSGTPAVLYKIEKSDNLTSWTLLTTAIADATGHFEYEDTSTNAAPPAFYRAFLPP